jgi:sulfur-oxidizing protein SoxY
MKRRSFVKGTLSASVAGLAVGAGLIPASLLAEDKKAEAAAAASKDAEAKPAADAAKDAEAKPTGDATSFDSTIIDSATASDKIKLKAPDVAENGAVVPVTVDASSLEGVTKIQIIATNNPDAIAGTFNLAEGTVAFASTRIKMGKTGPVIALVTVGDKSFKAQKDVKVTIGGCGG